MRRRKSKIYIFLLLLIISNSFSQDKFENKTKLTFYKLINEYDDGPSHINGYLKDNTTYFTQKVTIENCDKIILDLLKSYPYYLIFVNRLLSFLFKLIALINAFKNKVGFYTIYKNYRLAAFSG